MKAIAAMSLDRVIGINEKIPWNVPRDMKFFKSMTLDQSIVVGYNTYSALPILPRRNIYVLTHRSISDVVTEGVERLWKEKGSSIKAIGNMSEIPKDAWICGGQTIYDELLTRHCSDLYLTTINIHIDGNKFFPHFEYQFDLFNIIEDTSELKIEHYKNKSVYE